MKLLYLTPTYNSYSELWQHRHIEMLSEHIYCIASISPNEKKWRNRVPVIDLNPEEALKTKVFKRLKIETNNEQRISNHVKKLITKVDKVFVQYLTFAVRFVNIINNSNKPVFIHCHGYDVTWDLRSHKSPNKRIHNKDYIGDILKFKRNVYYIANSEVTKKKLLEIGINEKQIFIKYLGTEIPKEIEQKRNQNEFNILYLGRLIDFKGPDLVIEAFNLASKRGLDANLIIAGDGQLRITCELLKQKSAFSNKIQILGVVNKEQGVKLRREADIFIAHNCTGSLSGQEEAFGVSIIEAMAAGIPVLTGKSGGVMETVIDGETGLLNEPFDIEKQAGYVLYLYKNRDIAKKMGQAGRKRVVENFSFDKEMAVFNSILRLNE